MAKLPSLAVVQL